MFDRGEKIETSMRGQKGDRGRHKIKGGWPRDKAKDKDICIVC